MGSDPAYPAPVLMDEFRIYTTKGCNIACGFCSYAFRKNEAYMDGKGNCWENARAKQNLEQMRKDFNVRSYMFSGVEPTLDWRWTELALGTNVEHVRFNTNGVRFLDADYLFAFQQAISKLKKHGRDFWMYVSYSEEAHLKIFKRLAEGGLASVAYPYIVVNKENFDHVNSSVREMAKIGYKRFYIRFEFPVTEGPNYDPSRAAKLIEHQHQPSRLLTLANAISYARDAVIDTPIDTHPSVAALNNFDFAQFPIKVNKRFEHSRCVAYELSLTINFNGDITGCPKHSYHQDQTPYIVGNILDYDFEKLKAAIVVAPKTYCLPVKA